MGFSGLFDFYRLDCHISVNSFYTYNIFAKCCLIHNFLVDFCRMLEKLKSRWKVNSVQLILILVTFALGGSCCGYLGRKILTNTGLEKGLIWALLYIIIICILWPICVIIISIPLGQYAFFKKYILRISQRMTGKHKKIPSIAIFASGAGSNAAKIIEYLSNTNFSTSDNNNASNLLHPPYEVKLIVCNKVGAGVLNIAAKHQIETLLIEKEKFFSAESYIQELQSNGIDWIILAGFLWKIPASLVQAYPDKIINIHPALLPAYGGKGMYGSRVHEAVIAAGEKESGITIHYVDDQYDHGKVILQKTCQLVRDETPDSLAAKIHVLEHEYYPKTIASLLKG